MTSVHAERKKLIRERWQESEGTRALRAWVAAQGKSINQCAKSLGFRPAAFGDWLRGAVPYLEHRIKLAAVCGVPLQAWPKHRAPRRVETQGKEETGKIGKLTIGARAPSIGTGARFWCTCECGAVVVRFGAALRTARKRGLNISCGSSKCSRVVVPDWNPGTIGRVRVLGLAQYISHDLSLYNCECACGAQMIRRKRALVAAQNRGMLAMCRGCVPEYNRALRRGGSALDAWQPLRCEAAE